MSKFQDKDLDDTPFNMAFLFYIRLSKLQEQRDMFYLNKNYDGWYRSIKAMYKYISFKITREEKKILLKQFDECKGLLNSKLPGRTGRQFQEINLFDLDTKLDVLDCDLMEIMNKRNMIFPNIDSNKAMKEIRARYGI